MGSRGQRGLMSLWFLRHHARCSSRAGTYHQPLTNSRDGFHTEYTPDQHRQQGEEIYNQTALAQMVTWNRRHSLCTFEQPWPASMERRGSYSTCSGDPRGHVKADYSPRTMYLLPPSHISALLTSETLKPPSLETKPTLCKVKTSSSGLVLQEIYK